MAVDDRAATLHDVNLVKDDLRRLDEKIDRVEEKLEAKIDKVDGKVEEVRKIVLKIEGQMEGFLKGSSI